MPVHCHAYAASTAVQQCTIYAATSQHTNRAAACHILCLGVTLHVRSHLDFLWINAFRVWVLNPFNLVQKRQFLCAVLLRFLLHVTLE